MEWLQRRLKKELSTFMRFALVGAVWTAINIATDILFIDKMGLAGWIGSMLSYIILYVGRYFTYLLFKVIEPQFWKYVWSTLIFTLVMWGLKILAIDYLGHSATIASPVITIAAFVFKYFFYKSINLLKADAAKEG